MSEEKKLRFITYLSPGIPVKVFETIMQYIEEVTGMDTCLIYESRWTGPPCDKPDPFTQDEVDIGFLESTDYLRLVQNKHKYIDLCQAGAVHNHAKNAGRPVRYSDLIINSLNSKKFKELHDLRGHTLGYSSSDSVSACKIVLEHLRKSGSDATFFSDTFESGSHLASIQSVLESRVDVAAIDSTVLQGYLDMYPHHKDNLSVILTLGPLPTYPIVFNNRLPENLRTKITKALLEMSKNDKWCQKFEALNISGFVPCDSTLFNLETEIQAVKGLKIAQTYY